jgi:hypothetical protein
MACERAAGWVPAGHVPQPDGPVLAARSQQLPIRTERDAQDVLRVAAERFADLLSGCDAPQQYRIIRAGRGQDSSIRAERQRIIRYALQRFSEWAPAR